MLGAVVGEGLLIPPCPATDLLHPSDPCHQVEFLWDHIAERNRVSTQLTSGAVISAQMGFM